MTQKQTLSLRYTLGLIAILALVVIGGKYSIERTQTVEISDSQIATSSPHQQAQDTTVQSTNPDSEITPASSQANSCVETLKRETAAAKIEYEQGSVLVGFTNDVSFDQAADILASYGVKIAVRSEAQKNYPARKLITASTLSGDEFAKICVLRNNSHVRYADLNKLFTLHD